MSLNLALTSAVSGLNTAQAGLDVISNNIANVNTEGYTRKQFVAESVILAGRGAGVRLSDIINHVDQSLLKDLRKQHSAVGLLESSNKYYQRIQDTFGTTGSNSSISNRINQLQEEISSLSTDPSSVSQQLSAVQAARSVAENIKAMSETLQTLRMSADLEIENAATLMNNLLANISSLNSQISINQAGKRQVEDLQDKRDVALNKLSDLIDVSYFSNADGSVSVYTRDGTTLVDSSAATASHAARHIVGPTMTFAGKDFNGIFAGVRDITSGIRDGKIKGLIEMRDGVLPNMQAQLDELAHNMMTEINRVHNRGTSYPTSINQITGSRTFMSSATQTITLSGAQAKVILHDINGAEIASSNVLDAAGINFTNGGTVNALATAMQAWVRLQDAQLVNATVAVNADGNMAIDLGTETVGIAFRDEESSIKGSDQQDVQIDIDLDAGGLNDRTYFGFSNFLGLNDYLISRPNLSLWDTGFKTANYTLGIPAARTLVFTDTANPTGIPAGTVIVNPGESLEQIAANVNAKAALQGRVKAEVVPEGSGERLRFEHVLGQQLVISEVGGRIAIDAMGINFSSNGIAQNLAVKQTLIDDASRISRGEVKLDTLKGTYVLAEGDNTVAVQMADLLVSKVAFNPAGLLGGTSVSFSDYAASIISRNSTEAAAAKANLKLQEDLKGALDLKAAQASGVNLDEEMATLIVYQQTYAASAKVISTTQQLFDILNNLVQ